MLRSKPCNLQDQTAAGAENCTSMTGGGALRTDTLYDGFGRPIETDQYETSGKYIATTTAYDALGRVLQTTNPSEFSGGSSDGLGYATSYAYDGLGRVLSMTPPDLSTVTASYSGNQTTATVPGGEPGMGNSVPIVHKSTTDVAGRVISVVENPSGSPSYTTSYAYDVLNNLLSVTQGSETRTFAYDSLSRLLIASNPESGTVCYGTVSGSTCTPMYDANGNLLNRTDARGILTTYTYDALNRPSTVAYSDGTPSVAYAYGTSTGFYDRLVSVTAGSGSTAVINKVTGYDGLGRITSSEQSVNGGGTYYTFSYAWNRAGALTSETYPSSRVVSTGYDGANRPNSLTSGATTYVSSFSYAPHGAPTKYLYANGLNRAQTFNNRLQPTDMKDWLTTGGAASPLLELAYTYAGGGAFNNGDPTQIGITTAQTPSGVQTNFTQSYAYDAFNHLCAAAEGVTLTNCSSSVSGGAWAQQFSYDQYGNMTGTSTGTGIPALPSGSYNLQNQLTGAYTCGSTGSVPFDCSGNQRTIGSSLLSYDGENRQTQDYDTVSGNTINYTYDGMGERVMKALVSGSTTVYVRDAFGNLAAEYTTGGAQPMPCTTCYLSWDHLGSTRIVTDSGGNVVPYGRHDYLPFGYEVPAGVDGRTLGYWPGTGSATDYLTAKYTGAERDTETGFDFMQARYHANVQGRFMSPDPGNAGAGIGNPQSWNGYSYVGNNPMAFVDPSGLDPCVDNTNPETGASCVSVTDSSDGLPTIPSAPAGTCYDVTIDNVPQQNNCDEGLNMSP